MMSKILAMLSVLIFSITHPEINLSGLLSSDLSKGITTSTQAKKPRINLSGELTSADLSAVIQNKVSHKQMLRLSGLLSSNQLDSVIQFMGAKKKQRENISGLISSKDLDQAIDRNTKKKKPRINLSSFLVKNYEDPDYQAAFKILNNPELKREYDQALEDINIYYKEFYIRSNLQSNSQPSIELPKICCPDSGQNYTLCQTEQ